MSGPKAAGLQQTRFLRQAAGYAFALACLIWVFHDVHFEKLWQSMRGVSLGWVMLAIAVDILSYVVQGWRWQLLLRPINPISVLQVTQAIYMGLFTNEILPLRVGELVRGYMASRWLRVGFLRVVPTMAIERWFDGLWLAVGLGLTAIFVPLPRDLAKAGVVLGVLMLLATVGFVYLVWKKREASEREKQQAHGPLQRFVASIAADLREAGKSRRFYMSFVLSLALLALQALAFWMVMVGYGLHLSFWVGLVVLLILHLGTAIPNAPANVGSYQFFVVVGLALFGVEKTEATGFSIVVFAILTAPLWIIGLLAFSQSGTTLGAIRSDLRKLLARESPEHRPAGI